MADPASYSQFSQGANQQTAQNTNTSQATSYSPAQQGMQGSLGSMLQQFLSGQVPSSFTDPTALMNQYNQQFNNSLAPQLAAQYGAGSPQIGSQYNQGLVNLLGNQYNQGFSNYSNALGQGLQYAFQPIGSTGNQNTQMQGQGTVSGNSFQTYPLALLASLLGTQFGSNSAYCDERIKEDIEEIGKIGTLRLVRFKYKNFSWLPKGIHIGLIAQEVEKVFPQAVIKTTEGIRKIVYSRLSVGVP